MNLILALCIGVLFGVLMTTLAFKGMTDGKLHVVVDEQDGSSYLFLELNKNVDTVKSKKFATFEITQK